MYDRTIMSNLSLANEQNSCACRTTGEPGQENL